MTSILFLTEAIYSNMIRCNYLQKKVFLNLSVVKLRFNFEHFQEKMTFIADVFLNLQTPKNVVV